MGWRCMLHGLFGYPATNGMAGPAIIGELFNTAGGPLCLESTVRTAFSFYPSAYLGPSLQCVRIAQFLSSREYLLHHGPQTLIHSATQHDHHHAWGVRRKRVGNP